MALFPGAYVDSGSLLPRRDIEDHCLVQPDASAFALEVAYRAGIRLVGYHAGFRSGAARGGEEEEGSKVVGDV